MQLPGTPLENKTLPTGWNIVIIVVPTYTAFVRAFDAKERYRLPLHKAAEEVGKSRAVVVHLLDSKRQEALVHNARCAFVAGLALASQKLVLMWNKNKFCLHLRISI